MEKIWNRRVGVAMDFSATKQISPEMGCTQSSQPPNSNTPKRLLFQHTALIPLEEFREVKFEKQYGLSNDPEVLYILDTLATSQGAEVVAKVYWGDPREKLCEAVEDLKLDLLVIGSRGLGPIKSVF